ncbi:copper amine oxidase N-terminal domain-containing protein [Paenibacillus hunanensis]|uniref:copper amine oxidase N-terminal domain-containing protein n=1 Tax=Paenibacillus hunanensis TaxID=539262 RepID=UPI002A6B337E|nr:copper amine oxidase N-terminal domain-containing protein [Paenibacillus hunanensis]WPP41766.1 copper amine oxidase N-terminal domain-containing protein [Paenibacillus hunanensis]
MIHTKPIASTILGAIFAGGLITSPLGNYTYATPNPIQIVSENGIISSDIAPYVLHGVTLVPIHVINKLAKKDTLVTWDNTTKTVTVTSTGKQTLLQINQSHAMQNGQPIALSQAAILKDGRVMIPLRFIGESIGEKVRWDAQNRMVTIGDVSSTTQQAAIIQALQTARTVNTELESVTLGAKLPTIGIQTIIQYFPVGRSDVYFDSTDDLISYYKVENNKRYELWTANYKMDVPAKNEGLPFFPYTITKEVGKRPTMTTPMAYYVFRGAISDLRYGVIDMNGKETEISQTDPSQTKVGFPVSPNELSLIK